MQEPNGLSDQKQPSQKQVVADMVESSNSRKKRIAKIFWHLVDKTHPSLPKSTSRDIKKHSLEELQDALNAKFSNEHWLDLYKNVLMELIGRSRSALCDAFLDDYRFLNGMFVRFVLHNGRENKLTERRVDLNQIIYCGYLMAHFWNGNVYYTLLSLTDWSEEEICRLLHKLEISDPRISISTFIANLLEKALFSKLDFMFYIMVDSGMEKYESYSKKIASTTVNHWISECYNMSRDLDAEKDDNEELRRKYKAAVEALEVSRGNFRSAIQKANKFQHKFEDAIKRLIQKKKYYSKRPTIGYNPQKELWLCASDELPSGYIKYKLIKETVLSPSLLNSPQKKIVNKQPFY